MASDRVKSPPPLLQQMPHAFIRKTNLRIPRATIKTTKFNTDLKEQYGNFEFKGAVHCRK